MASLNPVNISNEDSRHEDPTADCSLAPRTLTDLRGTIKKSLKESSETDAEEHSARRLHRRGFVAGFSRFGDTVTILVSCIFFLHGILVFQYDGVAVKHIPKLSLLQDGAKYGPTVFPILFAAIVGQAMHAIALWRLEHGERLGVLDQFLGSTTIFATVTTQLKFQRVSALGTLLVLLWSLSPVGGQASLRVLQFAFRTTTQTATLYYMDSGRSEFLPGTMGQYVADVGPDRVVAHAIIHAGLMAPMEIKTSSMDSWGNVKIPFLQAASRDTAPDPQGWYPLTSENTVFTSLVGLPMSSLGKGSNATFSLETQYMSMNCSKLSEGIEDQLYFHMPGVNSGPDDPDLYTMQNPCIGYATDLALLDKGENARRANGTFPDMPMRKIYYKGVNDKWPHSYAECELSSEYVEVDFSCVGRNCSATRIRESIQPHLPKAWTKLDVGYMQFFGVFSSFLNTTCSSKNQQPTPIQRYFTRPSAPYNSTPDEQRLHNLTKEAFGYSWSQIFNTVMTAGMGMSSLPTKLLGNIPGGEVVAPVIPGGIITRQANVEITNGEQVLVCNTGWLAALLVATIVMFLIGVWGIVLDHIRKAPDIAMNISSMIKDNPHVSMSTEGTTMDAAERMRKLHNMRVRLGDVHPHDEIGYIAISSYGKERFVDLLIEDNSVVSAVKVTILRLRISYVQVLLDHGATAGQVGIRLQQIKALLLYMRRWKDSIATSKLGKHRYICLKLVVKMLLDRGIDTEEVKKAVCTELDDKRAEALGYVLNVEYEYLK